MIIYFFSVRNSLAAFTSTICVAFFNKSLYNNSRQTGEGAEFEDFLQLVIVNAKISVLKVVTSTFPLFGLVFIFSRFIFEIILMAIFPDIIFLPMNFPSTYLKLHCKRSFIFVKANKNFNLFLKCVCPILLTRCEICSYVPDKFYPFKKFFFSKFHNWVAVVIAVFVSIKRYRWKTSFVDLCLS